MFDFLFDIGNHESRVVANFKQGDLIVDTAMVSDGDHPYETGVAHPKYNKGEWVIVEAYDTKEDAQIGHDKWVATMTSESLPSALVDCANAAIADLSVEFGADLTFRRED